MAAARSPHPACGAVLVLAGALGLTGAAFGQLRMVNYNVAQLAGDAALLQGVLAAAHADDIPGYAKPVDVFCFSEVLSTNLSELQGLVNGAAPAGATYSLATYTSSGSEDNATGAQACFYRNETLTEVAAGHADIYTQAGRNSDRWLLTLDGYSSSAARFYIYSSHLKASTGSANQDLRLEGAQSLRANADALGAGVRAVFVGDYNIYTNSEPAYEHMISAGNGQCVDPWGIDNWTGASNAIKHTQSPRLPSGTLIGGGMDDRFDLHLATGNLSDGNGIAVIPGSIRSLGNDGQHYDDSINTGNNTYYPGELARSNALADALFDASDHIPVMVEYQIPARLSASLGAVPPRVIQNSAVTFPVLISNTAAAAALEGVDDLPFVATGAEGASGTASGTAAWAPATSTVNMNLVTTQAAVRDGAVSVSSTAEACETPLVTLPFSFTVVRRSNPSLSATQDINTLLATWAASAADTEAFLDVPVHNFAAAPLQSLMDIDSVQVLSGPATFVSGAATGIGTTPAVLRFRIAPSSLGAGSYTGSVRVNTSDENIPGQTTALVTVDYAITVSSSGPAADLNGDGHVDGADLTILLSQWGGPGAGDLSGNGSVGGEDLAMLLGSWG